MTGSKNRCYLLHLPWLKRPGEFYLRGRISVEDLRNMIMTNTLVCVYFPARGDAAVNSFHKEKRRM